MADAAPTCDRCGSTRIRHARSHTFVQRWVRELTEWDRYACGDCGHRGWRKGKLVRRALRSPAPVVRAPGRRAERRDARFGRRVRVRVVVTVLIGLLLGVAAAYTVLKLGATSAPPPE